MKVVCTGGGTGGHALPALAVIKAIERKDSNAKIIFVGSRLGIESKLVPRMGIKYYGISVGKFRRYHKSTFLNIVDPTTVFKNARDFFGFLSGIKEAKSILLHEKPDVVFAKGGFVSLPVGYAARSMGVPIVVHESDAIMGLANKKISRFADKVCVSFPVKNYSEVVDKEKTVETGSPIRDDILMGEGASFKKKVGFDDNKKTLLVLGGSQGSRLINELVLGKIEEILANWQLIWVAGEKDCELISYQLEDIDKSLKKNVKVYGFLTSEMADAYAAADLVVSRAGSNVLFELAALEKPSILIPFDESASSHQAANAKMFSRTGAAYLFDQKDIDPKSLFRQIKYLFDKPEELESMRGAMKKWADIGSSEKVAEIILESGRRHYEQSQKAKG